MAVDTEKVKDALDDFEDDKFADAKEKLSDVIGKARDEFLKKALNLKGEPEKEEEEPEDKEEKKDSDEKEEKETKDDAEEKDASSKEDEKKATKKRIAKAIKKKQDK